MATWQEMWGSWDADQRIAFVRFGQGGNITQKQIDDIFDGWATEHFGALAAFMKVPDVAPLLRQAAHEGWTQDRLQVALADTTWWKTTSAAQRQWMALSAQDPAEAAKQTKAMEEQIRALVSKEGVAEQYTDERITQLATTLLSTGADAAMVPKAVLADVKYNPTQPVGALGQQMSNVKQRADDYVVPISDQSAFQWAKQIETGQATQDGYNQYLQGIAKGQFADLADRIDAGQTVKQLLNPQIQTIAQLWNVDPNTIDLRDPTLAPVIQHHPDPARTTDPARVMTIDETARFAKQDDRYWQTTGAEAEAAKFVTNLSQQLGRG